MPLWLWSIMHCKLQTRPCLPRPDHALRPAQAGPQGSACTGAACTEKGAGRGRTAPRGTAKVHERPACLLREEHRIRRLEVAVHPAGIV